jgi:transcription elongation factor GreA
MQTLNISETRGQERLDFLHSQLEWVNAGINEFARDNDLEGQLEYLELLNQREHILQRIDEIQVELQQFDSSRVVDTSCVSKGVTIKLRDGIAEYEARIVEKPSTLTLERNISLSSPLGRALLGKTPGESVEVNTPAGTKRYEVMAVIG